MIDPSWMIAFWFVPFLILFLLARKSMMLRKIYIILSCGLMLLYVVFRIVFTIPLSSSWTLIFPILLLAAEIMGMLSSFVFSFMMFDKAPVAPPLPEPLDEGYSPAVDVLISTYNEPLKLVMATALAAKALPYKNKQIYICDDGRRSRLRELAIEHGIHYISRDNSLHAKAGNINHALSVTTGELILLLDADFITKPHILTESVPYFQDSQVALVQFPQSFYNKDPYQLASPKMYNDQDFFMRFEEPQLARYNAFIHIGTNAVFRRSALDEIGGIPTSSITEDIATGMLLQNAGFKTIYVNKSYALGLSPYNLDDFKKQRQRWARGNIQAFQSIKPMRLKGLNRTQKILYLDMFMYWFSSFQKLIYILSPVLFLLFRINIINLTLLQLVTIVIPYLLVVFFNLNILVGKERSFFGSHLYDTLVAPYHASAVIKELFHPEKIFHVTPKDTTSTRLNLKAVAPHIALLLVILAALVVGTIRMLDGSLPIIGYIVCFSWTVYNLLGVAFAVVTAKKTPIKTAGEALSVSIDEDVSIGDYQLNCFEMSFDGGYARFIGPSFPLEPGKEYEIRVNRTGLVLHEIFVGEQDGVLEFSFKDLNPEAALRLAAYYSEQLHAAKVMDLDTVISAK